MIENNKFYLWMFCAVFILAIFITVLGGIMTSDWGAVVLNLGTELVGVAITFLLFDLILGRRQKKEALISQMRSEIIDVAVPAVDELRREGWLTNGSLKGVFIGSANLEGARLQAANLEEANLYMAKLPDAHLNAAILNNTDLKSSNLNGAILLLARLKGTHFEDTNLRGADLRATKFIEEAFFNGAMYNNETKWPGGFDPKKAGAIPDPSGADLVDFV